METMNQSLGTTKSKFLTTSSMVKIGILSGVAFLLMYMDLPLPFFPDFLKIDLGDVPAILGTFAMGPIAGIIIEVLKNLLIIVFKGSHTGWVGEGANLLIGVAYVLPLGLVLRVYKKTGRVVIASVVAVIAMTLVGAISNYVFLIPFYAKIYGAPIQVFVDAAKAINPLVTDLKMLVLLAIVPFNLIKGAVISLLGCLLYKNLKGFLRLS